MKQRKCGNCGDRHPPGDVCAINWDARLVGTEDRQSGFPAHADEWPSGTYGHADYWFGYERDGAK